MQSGLQWWDARLITVLGTRLRARRPSRILDAHPLATDRCLIDTATIPDKTGLARLEICLLPLTFLFPSITLYRAPHQNMERPLLAEADTHFGSEVRQSFSFFQQAFRWCLSLLCIAFLLATFRIHENKGNLTPRQAKTYNVITTALGLLLGLSFFVSLSFKVFNFMSLNSG